MPGPFSGGRFEHGGAVDPSVFQIEQGAVGFFHGIEAGPCPDGYLLCQLDQRAPVASGVGRHASQRSLLEQVAQVIETGNRAQVDPGDGQDAAAIEVLQGGGDEFPPRRKQDGRIEGVGRGDRQGGP